MAIVLETLKPTLRIPLTLLKNEPLTDFHECRECPQMKEAISKVRFELGREYDMGGLATS